jgi:hypothetical protein
MRITSLTLAVFLACLWLRPSEAGDYFFSCATPGGGFFLEEGDGLELYEGETRIDYEPVREITIHESEGTCSTAGGHVFAWESRSYLYEINALLEDVALPLMFLCEQGGSGVPASVSDCEQRTVRDRRLVPTYTEAVD